MERKVLFAAFTVLAAWQDARRKQVDVWIYVVFGVAALLVCIAGVPVSAAAGNLYAGKSGLAEAGGWQAFADCLAGSALGLALLVCGYLCGGEIGAGDGCYFVVSGMLLGFWSNLLLLGAGTLLCGVYALAVYVRLHVCRGLCVRRMTVPFLPFVAVPGIGAVLWEVLRG